MRFLILVIDLLVLGLIYRKRFNLELFCASLIKKNSCHYTPNGIITPTFQGNTSIVSCFGVDFLCCLHLMYVFYILVKKVQVGKV